MNGAPCWSGSSCGRTRRSSPSTTSRASASRVSTPPISRSGTTSATRERGPHVEPTSGWCRSPPSTRASTRSSRAAPTSRAALNSAKVREADAAVGVATSRRCSPQGEKRLRDAVPGYYPSVVKAGTVGGVVEDTCIIAYDTYFFAGKDVPDQIVTAALKAVWETPTSSSPSIRCSRSGRATARWTGHHRAVPPGGGPLLQGARRLDAGHGPGPAEAPRRESVAGHGRERRALR